MSVPRPAMLVATVTRPGRAGEGDHLGLRLVLLGIEQRMLDARRASTALSCLPEA